MVVYRRLPAFDHAAPVKAWIFGIARKLARKYHERQPRAGAKPALVSDTAFHGDQAPDDGRGDPDAALVRRRAAQVVKTFLASLDADKRVVFILAEVEGMTAPEVAAAAGIKLNTVYSRLRTARALFAKAVARAQARQDRSRPRSPHDVS